MQPVFSVTTYQQFDNDPANLDASEIMKCIHLQSVTSRRTQMPKNGRDAVRQDFEIRSNHFKCIPVPCKAVIELR